MRFGEINEISGFDSGQSYIFNIYIFPIYFYIQTENNQIGLA